MSEFDKSSKTTLLGGDWRPKTGPVQVLKGEEFMLPTPPSYFSIASGTSHSKMFLVQRILHHTNTRNDVQYIVILFAVLLPPFFWLWSGIWNTLELEVGRPRDWIVSRWNVSPAGRTGMLDVPKVLAQIGSHRRARCSLVLVLPTQPHVTGPCR